LRCISQLVSYELVFSLVFLTLVLGYNTLEIINIINQQKYTWGCLDIIVFLLFFVASLAETNRTPFDLAEAESELVSGYNTEHSSVLFTYMFLAEYCYIFIISNIIVILFFGG
jgi:NADH:ubiquinone oxidoreductase subunit H